MRQRDIIDVLDPAGPEIEQRIAELHALTDANPSAAAALHADILAHIETYAPAETAHDVYRRATLHTFANPEKSRRWKAAALNLNRDDPQMIIALNGMAPIPVDGKFMLGVAYPAPAPLQGGNDHIEDIVLIDHKTGAASLYSEQPNALIPARGEDSFTVHADARVWAREQATARLEWFYARQAARRDANITIPWDGRPTSALAIGDIRKIHWPEVTQITACTGIDAKTLRSTLFRQARIPHVEAPLALGRAA